MQSPGLGALFTNSHVVVEETHLLAEVEPLFAEEAALVARAVPGRQREFAVGRHCAHRALARIGVPAGPLLASPDRAPRWPEGIVGSITHTRAGAAGFCAAAVAERRRVAALGIDAESAEPLPRSLWHQVLDPEEARGLEREPAGVHLAKVIFSAKEATYKALSSGVGKVLDFADVHIHLLAPRGAFVAELRFPEAPALVPGARCEGRFATAGDLVLTAVALPAMRQPTFPCQVHIAVPSAIFGK